MAILRVQSATRPQPRGFIKHELNFAQAAEVCVFPKNVVREFYMQVFSHMKIEQCGGPQGYMVVLTESDFESIVDYIWDNVQRDAPDGFRNKGELRRGLREFMLRLPGNPGAIPPL